MTPNLNTDKGEIQKFKGVAIVTWQPGAVSTAAMACRRWRGCSNTSSILMLQTARLAILPSSLGLPQPGQNEYFSMSKSLSHSMLLRSLSICRKAMIQFKEHAQNLQALLAEWLLSQDTLQCFLIYSFTLDTAMCCRSFAHLPILCLGWRAISLLSSTDFATAPYLSKSLLFSQSTR